MRPDIGFDDFLGEVDALPQGRFIRDHQAKAWYDAARQDPYHDIGWHFSRLKGFGGSDVGTLVANHRGEFDPFKNARDVVGDKLMRTPPSLEDLDFKLERGSDLEPLIQSLAMRRVPGVRRRPDVLNSVKRASNEDHPWLRGTPDDAWEIDGKIYLVDYKAPGQAPDGNVMFAYECQLNTYDFLFNQETGEWVDGLILCPLDYPNWTVMPIEVARDVALQQEILDVGDESWSLVLRGELPNLALTSKKTIEYSDQEMVQIRDAEREVARLTLLEKQIGERRKAAVAELQKVVTRSGKVRVKGAELPASVMSLVVKEYPDNEAMERLMEIHGLDKEQFMEETAELDAPAMADRLEDLGEQPIYRKKFSLSKFKDFCREHHLTPPTVESLSPSIRVAKKRGMTKERVESLKHRAGVIVDEMAERLSFERVAASDAESPSETEPFSQSVS